MEYNITFDELNDFISTLNNLNENEQNPVNNTVNKSNSKGASNVSSANKFGNFNMKKDFYIDMLKQSNIALRMAKYVFLKNMLYTHMDVLSKFMFTINNNSNKYTCMIKVRAAYNKNTGNFSIAKDDFNKCDIFIFYNAADRSIHLVYTQELQKHQPKRSFSEYMLYDEKTIKELAFQHLYITK